MAENALLEKMLDLPEFTITDLQHNDYDIRIYVVKKDKPSVCPICGSINQKVRVHSNRVQEVRDKNILGKRVGLMYKRIGDVDALPSTTV